jgi:hypothetical protein
MQGKTTNVVNFTGCYVEQDIGRFFYVKYTILHGLSMCIKPEQFVIEYKLEHLYTMAAINCQFMMFPPAKNNC